jgi:hypothetical protein
METRQAVKNSSLVLTNNLYLLGSNKRKKKTANDFNREVLVSSLTRPPPS